jgi:hypothetical protein
VRPAFGWSILQSVNLAYYERTEEERGVNPTLTSSIDFSTGEVPRSTLVNIDPYNIPPDYKRAVLSVCGILPPYSDAAFDLVRPEIIEQFQLADGYRNLIQQFYESGARPVFHNVKS